MRKEKYLKTFQCILVISIIIAPFLKVFGAEQTKPIVLIFSETRQVTHPWTKCALKWQEQITQKTNGMLKFKNYYGGTLIGPRKSMDEIAAGTADICRVSAFMQGGGFDIQNASQKFYYGAKDTETTFGIYRKSLELFTEFSKEWAKGGKTLAANGPGPMHLHTSRIPVRTLADFKGLQIRGIGPWMMPTFKKLGAASISIPPSEIYIALQKNIIDGYIHPWESLKSLGLGEVAKYTTILDVFDGCGDQLLMNWKSYNNLPSNLKRIFDESLDEFQADFVISINQINEEALAWAKEKGHEIIELSPEELSEYYKLLDVEAREEAKKLDEKGLPGTKIFEFVRNEIEKSK